MCWVSRWKNWKFGRKGDEETGSTSSDLKEPTSRSTDDELWDDVSEQEHDPDEQELELQSHGISRPNAS